MIAPQPGESWQHLKKGTVYNIVGVSQPCSRDLVQAAIAAKVPPEFYAIHTEWLGPIAACRYNDGLTAVNIAYLTGMQSWAVLPEPYVFYRLPGACQVWGRPLELFLERFRQA